MTATDERVFCIWVTALLPKVDHAVTDEEMAARNTESRGQYRALCGAQFLPAPDDQPPGQTCPECARFLRARATERTAEHRLRDRRGHRGRHARPGWWSRARAEPECGGDP